jgi:membrane protein DedA with SNARE-associated domain
MNVVLALLAVSALVGLALGVFFSWIAIFVSGVIIAICGGMISHNESLEFFAGISFIVACLCINQIAYLVGVRMLICRHGCNRASPPASGSRPD